MLQFIWSKYYLKAKDNLTSRENDAPSIEMIWREAMRIAWPELDFEIKVPDGNSPDEEGPFLVIIANREYRVRIKAGKMIYLHKKGNWAGFPDKMIAIGHRPTPLAPDLKPENPEPEDPNPDYTGPKTP